MHSIAAFISVFLLAALRCLTMDDQLANAKVVVLMAGDFEGGNDFALGIVEVFDRPPNHFELLVFVGDFDYGSVGVDRRVRRGTGDEIARRVVVVIYVQRRDQFRALVFTS